MSKVVLSNGSEFTLVANAVSEGTGTLAVTFLPEEYTVEQLEGIWTGNALIKVIGDDAAGSVIRNFNGYTRVSSIEKRNDYEQRIEEGEPVLITVCTVVVAKPNLENRVTDVEEAVEDIINSIL